MLYGEIKSTTTDRAIRPRTFVTISNTDARRLKACFACFHPLLFGRFSGRTLDSEENREPISSKHVEQDELFTENL